MSKGNTANIWKDLKQNELYCSVPSPNLLSNAFTYKVCVKGHFYKVNLLYKQGTETSHRHRESRQCPGEQVLVFQANSVFEWIHLLVKPHTYNLNGYDKLSVTQLCNHIPITLCVYIKESFSNDKVSTGSSEIISNTKSFSTEFLADCFSLFLLNIYTRQSRKVRHFKRQPA